MKRLITRILHKDETSRLVGIYAKWGYGKTSTLNFCKEYYNNIQEYGSIKKSLWIDTFETWRMDQVNDLPVAMLWHIQNNLPEHIKSNSEITRSIKRICLALTIAGVNFAAKKIYSNAITGLEVADKFFPTENSISSLPTFKACDQLLEIANLFDSIGRMIKEKYDYETIVVPIDDMDRCRPENAISLLFSIKNLMITDHFQFIFAIDKYSIAKFLEITYKKVFSVQDATWFLEKIFDDWVDIPLSPLSELLDHIEFPINTECIKEKILNTGMFSISQNPRQFIRGCQRFERFLKDMALNNKIDILNQIGLYSFGWCQIYSGYPEQIDTIVSAKGFGGQNFTFEYIMSICLSAKKHFDKLNKVDTSKDGLILRPTIESDRKNNFYERFETIPYHIKGLISDYSSMFMNFIGIIMHKETDNIEKILSESLIETLPYL